MKFAHLKNRFSSYRDDTILYDHLEYDKIFCKNAEYQIHDTYEIMFLKKGSIIYTAEGKSYRIKKGSLILTRPGQWHTLFFEDKNCYERYDISFDKSILSPQLSTKIPLNADVTNADAHPVIEELFRKMDYYCKYFEGEDLKNLLCHLTEEIIYNIILIKDVFSGEKSENDYSANPTLVKALEYIENNLLSSFSLDDLCNELYITKSCLHRLFSQYLQITPKKYINSKRLLMAQNAIRSGNKPAHIYQKCGFKEYSTFWRDYKKHFGYSPSEETDREYKREAQF